MADISRALALLREHGPGFATDIGVNAVLPLIIYSATSARLGQVDALIASSIPPILWSIVEFARRRRIDALSVLVLAGIALSLLALAGGGSVRFLQLREKLVTGVIGTVFLVSAAIGRPLIYELARANALRKSPADASAMEELRDEPAFRRSMTVITLVWGFGLIADVLVAIVLVFSLSIREYMVVNSVLGYAVMGALALWTFWYGRRTAPAG
jgi:hypothetical protein